MAKTRKPRQQRSRHTVNSIIEACLLCISRYGLEGCTTRKIAETAGISVGSLYEYFANKEEIYDALHEHVVNEIVGMAKPLIPELVKMDARDATRTLLFAFRDWLRKDNGKYLTYSTQMGHFMPARFLKPINHTLADLTIQYLMFHPELSRIPDLPVKSYIMIHGGIGAVVRHLSEPNPSFDFEALCEGLADMVQNVLDSAMEESA